MTQPLTGTTWNGAGLNDLGPEFLRRGKAVAVLSRDARGASTDISPHNEDGSVRYSPLAQDNTWRDDLLAVRKVNGVFVTVTDDNQGWFNLGGFKDGDGPQGKPKMTNDDFMIVQSNFPYDSDLTEESEAFSFTPVDTASPWVQRLINNRPFSDVDGNSLMEDPGASNAGFSRLLNGLNPGRQFLIVRERKWNGLPIYSIEGYALARLDDKGNSKKGDKKDSEGPELTYNPLPDGYFMALQDGEYQPILVHTWWGGAGWNALGGVPVLAATAPVAAATTAAHATLAFAAPTGPGDPYSYTAQQSLDAGVTWGTALTPTNVAGTSTITLTLAGLTAGACKLRATVTGTNGATATTPASNSITVT